MNFTLDNHLKCYIGDRLYGDRKTPYEKFRVEVGPVNQDYYKKSNWLQEQYRIADLIHLDLGKDFIVMFSGGTDSEIILRAFKHIGIDVKPVFIRFTGGHNLGELVAAKEVTDDLGLSLTIIDFDVVDFYRSGGAASLAKSLQCANLAYLTVYQNIINMGSPAIVGASVTFERVRESAATGRKWYYDFSEQLNLPSVKVYDLFGIPIIQEWFSYTPESIGYFLENPVIEAVITETNFKTYTDSSKNPVLSSWMPSIIPKIKKNGYENLKGLRHEAFFSLKKELVSVLEYSVQGMYVSELRNQLFGRIHDN